VDVVAGITVTNVVVIVSVVVTRVSPGAAVVAGFGGLLLGCVVGLKRG